MKVLPGEVVNKVNTLRRDLDFDVTDRIRMSLQTTQKVQQAVELHRKYIEEETLLMGLTYCENKGQIVDLNGEEACLLIEKV